jgi:glycerol-3-phosphate dehydrogenase
MTRDDLGRQRLDLLVVGGGIHGLFAAYDAAIRGLRVGLVERADFGSGLSFNHQRTVHGGLRALETGHVAKARHHIAERRAWARIAPHLVRPLPFVLGTYAGLRRSRMVIRVGLALYDVVGWDRNAGVPAALRLPGGEVISRDGVRARFPGIQAQGLTGGAVWYDYQTRHPDRLNWLVARAAMAAGATLVNYTEATGALRQGPRVVGARVRLEPSGEERDVEARSTLLCAGAGLAELHTRFGLEGAPALLRAMNLIFDRPALPQALAAAPGRSGRMLTCVPWQGRSLVGTFQSEGVVSAGASGVPDACIDEAIADARAAFPFLDVSRADVRVVHHGLTPAIVRGGRADLLPEPVLLRHGDTGTPGIDSLVGVKFTTSRMAAAWAIDRIAADLGLETRCETDTRVLPDATADGAAAALATAESASGLVLPDDVRTHLVDWYGTEAARVARYCAAAGLAGSLPGCAVLAGEIAYATDHGSAVHLSDAVLRRTPLGGTGHPGDAALAAAARVMAARRGWSERVVADEMAEVERRFRV